MRRPLALSLAGALALAPVAVGAAPPPARAVEAAAANEAAPPPFTDLKGWYRGVWSDGVVMLVADYFGVHLLCRGSETSYSPREVKDIAALAGAGGGEGFVAAGLGADGGVVLWREGQWRSARAPTVDGDELRAAAVDEGGAVYVAGSRRALYVARGDAWSVHRYPAGLRGEVQAALWTGDGELLLVGDQGLALRFADGALSPSTLLPASLRDDLRGAWMSPGGDLWLISDRDLLRRRADGSLTRHRPPIFGGLRGLSGAHSAAGDLVAVAAQSELVLFDGETFSRIDGSYSFPEGIYLDGAGAILYVAHRDGLRRLAIDHPRLPTQGLAARASCPLPAQPESAAILAEAARADLVAPVEAPAVEEVKPGKPAARQSIPSIRIGLGVASGAVAASEPGAADPIGAAFALDVLLGGTLGVRPKMALWPELGYSYSRLPGGANHLFLVGVGPLFGGRYAAFGVLPRLALGSVDGLLGAGVRTGLVGSFVYDMVAVEVAHQWLRAGGRDHHEARVMASLNVLPLFAVVVLARAFGRRGGIFGRRR